MSAVLFPPAAIVDGLGAIIRLQESRTQDGCVVVRIEPAKFSADHEVLLNHTAATMLRKALTLWLSYVEDAYDDSPRMFEPDEE